MKKLITISILTVILSIAILMAYTPPVYTSVNLTLDSSYIAPVYTSVNLTLGEAVTDTCSCPSGNWNVNLADYCVINSNCNIRPGNLSFYGTGNFTCNAMITISNLNKTGLSGGALFIKPGCQMYI